MNRRRRTSKRTHIVFSPREPTHIARALTSWSRAPSRVIDNGALARPARLWKDKIDWVFEVGDGVFLDAEAGEHPALVFAVTPSKVLAFRKSPYSQTRYVM